MRSLFIALPLYDGKITVPLMYTLLELRKKFDSEGVALLIDDVSGDPSIGLARTKLFCRYLDSGLDDMLFIDGDIEPAVDDILRIQEHPYGLVSGIYINRHNRGPITAGMPWRGLKKVAQIPLGFARIRYEYAMDMYIEYQDELSHWQTTESGRRLVNVFCQGFLPCTTTALGREITQNVYHEEDMAFSYRWRAMNRPIYMDGDIRLRHAGITVEEVEEKYVQSQRLRERHSKNETESL